MTTEIDSHSRESKTGNGWLQHRIARKFLRPATGAAVIMAAFLTAELLIRLLDVPAYILPAPSRVVAALADKWPFLLENAAITAAEIVVGLAAGATVGIATALAMAQLPWLMRALRPVLIVSQALPVFAIAPLLVIWFGFGLASKIVMAGLIIYFPVTVAFLDGLLRTDDGLIDLARLHRASRMQALLLIRVPFALPYLATGLRVAATVAPIGAVVGEWVGASAGLGFVMLQANARIETDTMFAALAILAVLALLIRAAVDRFCLWLAPWQPQPGRLSLPQSENRSLQ